MYYWLSIQQKVDGKWVDRTAPNPQRCYDRAVAVARAKYLRECWGPDWSIQVESKG